MEVYDVLDPVVIEDVPVELSPIERLLALADAVGDISEALEENQLTDIARRVVDDYEQDKSDREDWEKTVREALKSASQEAKGEVKNYPWPNAANIHYPLLTTAALQFNARAYPAIVKGDEAVSIKVVGKDNGRPLMSESGPVPQMGPGGQPVIGPEGRPAVRWLVPPGGKASRASRVRDYMNTVLFYRMEDWESDTDALLLQLPIVGCVFRKVMFDARVGQQRAAMVPALRLLAPKGAKSCKTSPRLTEELPDQFPSEIIAKMREGFYRDVDLFPVLPDSEPTQPDEKPRLLLEQHRLLDLDEDGLPEPYIVTVDPTTAQLLRIEPNFSRESIVFAGDRAIRINRGQFYVKYDFFPDPDGGFYGRGLGHLLKQIGAVIDTSINQMIDAGTAQIAGGGFVASGVRLTGSRRSGNLRFVPGEWKTLDVPADQLRNGLVDRTFPSPSPIMFQILELMLGAAKDISSVKDVITGDASNNGQVGTTLALIEQGLQVFTAIYKRVYGALKAEFQLLFENLGKYATEETVADYQNVLDDPNADFAADFNARDMDIRPVSDPASVTRLQKMSRAQFLGGFVNLPWMDGPAITRRMLEAADTEDLDDLFVPPQPPQPDPKMLADAADKEASANLKNEKAETERARREEMAVDAFARAFQMGGAPTAQ